jgi:hypothetical protein
MTDGDKIAAALLAAEASRQQQALRPSAAQQGYDIQAGILAYYRHFLTVVMKESQAKG